MANGCGIINPEIGTAQNGSYPASQGTKSPSTIRKLRKNNAFSGNMSSRPADTFSCDLLFSYISPDRSAFLTSLWVGTLVVTLIIVYVGGPNGCRLEPSFPWCEPPPERRRTADGRRPARPACHRQYTTHLAIVNKKLRLRQYVAPEMLRARLTSSRQGSKLANMEVNFTPHTEAQLKEFAARKGKDAAQVVEETVSNMLERQARFVEGVKRGIASADRGDLVEHEEVVSRIDRLFQP